jgi:hypothetical protein
MLNFGKTLINLHHFYYRSPDKTPIYYYIDWLKLHQSFCVKMTYKYQPFHEKPEIFSHFMKSLGELVIS